MKTVSGDLADHLNGDVTTLTKLWRLVRTDGTTFRFTEHDADIAYDGHDWLAAGGFQATAVTASADLSVDNLEVMGIFDSEFISADDLRAGLFDYADVYVSIVNWADLTMGEIKVRRGKLGEVVVTDQGTYQAELRGLTQALAQQLGDIYQPTCRVDLGSAKCGVTIRPAEVQRSTAYAVGDIRRGWNELPLPAVHYVIANPGAETGTLDGWTNESTTFSVAAVTDAPHGGTHAFSGAAWPGTGPYPYDVLAHQDIALRADQLDAIDAGNVVVDELSWWQVCNSIGGVQPAEMLIRWLDADGAQIGGDEAAGLLASYPYVQRSLTAVAVPAGARTLQLVMHFGHTSTTFAALAWIDDIGPLAIRDTMATYREFGDVYLECTTAGTTDSVAPTFDLVAGNTTTDGTVVWTARNALLRAGLVTGVVSHREIVADPAATPAGMDEPRAVDGWFDFGALTWTSGDNTGRTQEVKSWSATGHLVLFLPAPFAIQGGDRFEVYPGCAKRLLADCRDKFDNVVNHRGEAYLPGLDLVTSYPDAR